MIFYRFSMIFKGFLMIFYDFHWIFDDFQRIFNDFPLVGPSPDRSPKPPPLGPARKSIFYKGFYKDFLYENGGLHFRILGPPGQPARPGQARAMISYRFSMKFNDFQ